MNHQQQMAEIERQDRKWQEVAFRRAVARLYYAGGHDTAEVARRLECDEADVWNVLDQIKRERIDA